MNRKILKLLIIPLVITAIYFALQAFLLLSNFGVFSIVEEVAPDFKTTNQQDVHLLKDQKAAGTFKASENNLGILLIRVVKFGKGSDTVLFRIKKEGEEKWYYENKYWAEQFQNNQYFPFGFPLIANSKNNVYFFEIESLEGKYQNGIGVLKEKKAAAMYKYSVGELKNFDALSSFTSKKILYSLKKVSYWQLLATFVLFFLLVLFMEKKKVTSTKTIRFLLLIKNDPKQALRIIIHSIKSNYLYLEKKIVNLLKRLTHWFASTSVYLKLFNTNMKKRIVIGLLIFLLALTYRFSSTLVNQHLLFYAGLGGQGDYDQFIRAATCALNFCSYAILGQNFLLESSILGIFYKIFGFTGALKAYVYLMIILSSIVATLPYLLLSKKSWISVGGIIGSLFLATSDFLTHMSLNFPPDNGSLFTFSMFFVVYLLTIHIGTIKWLLFFGLIGVIDALNKALFILNDLVALGLFVPVFFYEKVKGASGSIFRKKNIKILLLSSLPLLIFLVVYIAWEYLVQIKFSAPYFLRGLLLSRGASYVSYTSFSDSSLTENIVSQLFYLFVYVIVMLKQLIQYTDLRIIFLAPIFLGMFILTFAKKKFLIKKFILWFILSASIIALLVLIKNNFLGVHKVFAGEYIPYNWKTNIYFQIFLFLEILFLFILNFRYSAIKLTLPIIFYVIMLITFAKNASIPRLHTHVVAWSVILLAFLIDWIMMNINKYWAVRARIILGSVLLILFIYVYMIPKTTLMFKQLDSGFAANLNQVRYLKWVERSLPENAVILAGGKSDLITVAENIKKPVVYNTLWAEALLIRPDEIPGVKPTDFNIVRELKNKDNFKKKRYLILEDDIYIWRGRLTGVVDSVFVISPKTLDPEDFSIKAYKFNPTLKKGIYELNLKDNL